MTGGSWPKSPKIRQEHPPKTSPCKMKRVQARDLAGGSEISRNYAAWRASADFSVLLRDPRDLRVKGRAQSYLFFSHFTYIIILVGEKLLCIVGSSSV